MNYYIGEDQIESPYLKNTAGTKARIDINNIFDKEIGNPVFFKLSSGFGSKKNLISKILRQFKVLKIWKRATENLKSGDRLFIQFPFFIRSIFLSKLFKKLKKRKVELVFLVHDLDWIRLTESKLHRKLRMNKEREQFNCADKYIVHNGKMAEYLINCGIPENKLIKLSIFDYLIPNFNEERIANRKSDESKPIIIAGNMARHKAKYVYELPNSCEWNLYGPHYSGEEKGAIHYKGSFQPDELPYVLEGSFGLVWDGDSCEICSGKYGEYLKINNPHKTSLYLASGIPVIIWKEAALADFIVENNCGLVVSSLSEIASAVNNLTDKQYSEMCENAKKIGQKLREGYFTKKAIEKVLN